MRGFLSLNMGELLEFKPKPKVEVSPGFLIDPTIEKCRTLSFREAVETVAGDMKFQAWEITKIPVSDPFYYQIVETPNDSKRKKKLVFECDTETGSDIRDVTSREWRGGKEARAVDAWVDLAFEEDEKLKKINKERAKQGLPPETRTIMQVNPKKDENDPTDTSNYTMAQANFAVIDGSGRIRQQQVQFPGDTEQCAKFFKKISKSDEFNPNNIKNIDDMMMSFSVMERDVSMAELLRTVALVTGQIMPAPETIERQKREISNNAKMGALEFYKAVQRGTSSSELTRLYKKLLGQTLPQEFMKQMRMKNQISGGGPSVMAMETSCGLVSFGEESNAGGGILGKLTVGKERWNYTIGDCVEKNCQKKNVKVGPCAICQDCEKKFDQKERTKIAA